VPRRRSGAEVDEDLLVNLRTIQPAPHGVERRPRRTLAQKQRWSFDLLVDRFGGGRLDPSAARGSAVADARRRVAPAGWSVGLQVGPRRLPRLTCDAAELTAASSSCIAGV